jgi:hypothetical protein
MFIDLGAERLIAAEQAGRKIAVEVKSFLAPSRISEFYVALGQFLTYRWERNKLLCCRQLRVIILLPRNCMNTIGYGIRISCYRRESLCC